MSEQLKLTTIEFTLEKTTPLEPLTGNESDRYANVKPSARVVIALDGDETQTEVADAWQLARNTCFEQLVEFHEALIEAIGR